MKRVLHVGCGGQEMPPFLEGYVEVRCDIDSKHSPDIIANMTDLGDIGTFDAVFGSHVLEHLAPHEVDKAMSEFLRVLNPQGIVVMIVPNLENVKPTRDFVYDSAAGPITGLDMYYGKESFVEQNPYMCHKTGFVPETLKQAFKGFASAETRGISGFNLLGIGVKA
jgi:SAM-dependent methyltransferase